MQPKLNIWSNYYHGFSKEEAAESFIKNGIYYSELSDEHGFEIINRSEDFLKSGMEFADFINKRNFEISPGNLWSGVKICSEYAVERLLSG